MAMKLLQVKDIVKKYGRQTAVDGVSFSIEEGEIVGFLGVNGAGKSTVMKIITGCLASDSGEVSIGEYSISRQALQAKRRIGYLPEDNPLYEEMYVREYLRYVLRLYGQSKEKSKVEAIIEATHLSPEAHKKISQLSKGYRQRVGLAQALIHNPDLLILDEPITGLDPLQIEETEKLIRHCAGQRAVLFSSHTLSEVVSLCTRILIIHRGRIVLDKPLSAIDDLTTTFKELTTG